MAGQGGVVRTGLVLEGISPEEFTISELMIGVFNNMVCLFAFESAGRLMRWPTSVCGSMMENVSGVFESPREMAQHCAPRFVVDVEAARKSAWSLCVASVCSGVVTGAHASLSAVFPCVQNQCGLKAFSYCACLRRVVSW